MVSARLPLALGPCFSGVLLSRMQEVWEDEILTKETKQDVFEDMALRYTMYLENVIYENGNQHSSDKEAQHDADKFRARYAAASPCKLPVIPQAVGDFITDWKSNHRGLFLAIISCNDVLSGFITPPITNCVAVWVAKYTDAFATAWLLGDWEVEDD